MPTVRFIFLSSILFIAYAYIGYPFILFIWSQLVSRPIKKKTVTPSVTLVICVHNEEKVIRRKLENCLELDYPKNDLEILISSDGSTDRTDEIIRQFSSSGIKLIRPFTERQGKAAALNQAVQKASGEIIVFSDARQNFDKKAIKELVANFYDPKVGGVSGELHLMGSEGTMVGEGVSLYWRYEKAIRKMESQIDSVVGATGAIYAIRKSLYKPLIPGTILDDLAIPMSIAAQGYRVIFEPEAMAYDQVSTSGNQERIRKVRTLSGNYQLLFQRMDLLIPWRNRLFFQFISHKVFCRLLVPFALIGAFVSNVFLTNVFYTITFIIQSAVLFLGLAGFALERKITRFKLLTIPHTFLLLNITSLLGLFYFLKGQPLSVWQKETEKEH